MNVFREVDFNISSSSVHVYGILKYDLEFTPIMQHPKDTDISSCLRFAHWMLKNIGFTDVIWFSDEGHFTLNGHVIKQNMRFWGTSKPDFYEERSLSHRTPL